MREGPLSLRPGATGSPRLISSRGRLLRSERGTAVVEFALIAPLLFLLLFGIIEFGRALNYYNDLTQLSGQGARAAIVNRNPDGTALANDGRCTTPSGNNSIQCQIAKTYPADGELQGGISVCLGTLNADGSIATTTTPQIGDPVTVRTVFYYPFLTKFFGFTTLTLRSTQTERLEATPTWQEGLYNGPNFPAGKKTACDAP